MATLKTTASVLPKIPGYAVYELYGRLVVRAIGTVSKGRRRNDPAYAQVRKNNAIFGMASGLNKIIRQEMVGLLRHNPDLTLVGRLQQACERMLQQHRRCAADGQLFRLLVFGC